LSAILVPPSNGQRARIRQWRSDPDPIFEPPSSISAATNLCALLGHVVRFNLVLALTALLPWTPLAYQEMQRAKSNKVVFEKIWRRPLNYGEYVV
jgi:hypothetical protein